MVPVGVRIILIIVLVILGLYGLICLKGLRTRLQTLTTDVVLGSTLFADHMVGFLDGLLGTSNTLFGDRERLVFAKALPPLDHLATRSAKAIDGQCQNLFCQLAVSVVDKGKLVCMGRGTALLGARAYLGHYF